MIFRRKPQPTVDEVPVLQPEEAKWILDWLEDALIEDGYNLPHNGGEWPPYGFEPEYRFDNEVYVKLLRIAEIPIDPIWRLPSV